MAEVQTAEETAKVDAAFGAGFGDTPPAPAAKVVDVPVVEPAKPAAVVAPAKPLEKPEYVRVTRQERDNDKAAIGKIAALESQLAKLTGSMPKADALVQQVIEAVRSQTPTGKAVRFNKAKIAEDFPELADRLEEAFSDGEVEGTGPASAGVATEPLDLEKAVESVLTKKAEKEAADKRESETKALIEAYPDWGKIVGNPFVMGTTEPVDTDWRKWAAANDPKALETNSPAEVQASIAKYVASQESPTPPKPDKGAVRRATLADAVTPRADGAAPPLVQPTNVDDAFAGGFNKSKRH